MGESYLGAVLRFACKGAILRTDQLSIVAAVLVPAVFVASGRSMPEWAAAYVAWAIIILVVGVIGLRLLMAPYFLWREQNAKIAELERKQDSPRILERQELARLLAAERRMVAEEATRIRTFILHRQWTAEEVRTVFHGSERHIDKFWHDEEFQRRWVLFTNEVLEFVGTYSKIRDAEGSESGGAALFRTLNKGGINSRAKDVIDYILYKYGDPQPNPAEPSHSQSLSSIVRKTLQ